MVSGNPIPDLGKTPVLTNQSILLLSTGNKGNNPIYPAVPTVFARYRIIFLPKNPSEMH